MGYDATCDPDSELNLDIDVCEENRRNRQRKIMDDQMKKRIKEVLRGS
jgi:hypothetical protein